MSVGQKFRRLALRGGICILLLGWVFHSIFVKEGRQAWEHLGRAWEPLSSFQQWKVAWTFGPPELFKTLLLIQPSAFLLSLLCVGLTIFLGILRWRMVLRVQGLDLPLRRAAGISFVAHFFNSFLLGSTGGDLIKAYYAARETHHRKAEAVVTVFVDRLLGLWSMLLFAALMMLPNLQLILRHDLLQILCGTVLLMLAGCTTALALALWGGVSRHFPKARAHLRKLPKGELLERSFDSCRQFGREKVFLLKAVMISMAINAVCVAHVWILSRGLGLTISPIALLVIVPMIISISALPITPSGLGVRENLFVLVLAASSLAIPATSALSLSLLTFAGVLFWSVACGFVYLFLKEREHLEEVTEADPVEEGASGDSEGVITHS